MDEVYQKMIMPELLRCSYEIGITLGQELTNPITPFEKSGFKKDEDLTLNNGILSRHHDINSAILDAENVSAKFTQKTGAISGFDSVDSLLEQYKLQYPKKKQIQSFDLFSEKRIEEGLSYAGLFDQTGIKHKKYTNFLVNAPEIFLNSMHKHNDLEFIFREYVAGVVQGRLQKIEFLSEESLNNVLDLMLKYDVLKSERFQEYVGELVKLSKKDSKSLHVVNVLRDYYKR